MSLLAERITSHLKKVVGQKLIDVSLFCYEDEISASAIENLPYYFSGELILNFESDIAIVTWDENAGWQDHFSLYIGCKHLYITTSNLVTWNISKLKPWHNYINQKLISTQIYGYNKTPHVVKFEFGNPTIFVGDSSEMSLGDGDDLLITTKLPTNTYDDWDLMWEVSSS